MTSQCSKLDGFPNQLRMLPRAQHSSFREKNLGDKHSWTQNQRRQHIANNDEDYGKNDRHGDYPNKFDGLKELALNTSQKHSPYFGIPLSECSCNSSNTLNIACNDPSNEFIYLSNDETRTDVNIRDNILKDALIATTADGEHALQEEPTREFTLIVSDVSSHRDNNSTDRLSNDCSYDSKRNHFKHARRAETMALSRKIMIPFQMGLPTRDSSISTETEKNEFQHVELGMENEEKRIFLRTLAEKKTRSPYFKIRKSGNHKKHSVRDGSRGVHQTIIYRPPPSPYHLIQEELYMKPWQLLVATIFLNRTSSDTAIPLFRQFVEQFESPHLVNSQHFGYISRIMRPLGLNDRRAKNIIRFSDEYLHKDWEYPIELYGIGKYGNDSYRIFCAGEWRAVRPQDRKLNLYWSWLSDQSESLN